jgi:hypothetical protein
MSIKVLFDSPIAKFIEENKTSMIAINLFKNNGWILNVNSPFLKDRESSFKLLLTHSAIITCINCFKSCPVFVVLP